MCALPNRKRERGFTLIEVLVAFVILALTLASAYASFSSGLTWERRAGETARAVLLARSYLAEAGVSRPFVEGVTEQTLEDGRTVRLSMHEVEPVPPGDLAQVSAWQVTVEIAQPGAPPLSLTELKLGPPPQ